MGRGFGVDFDPRSTILCTGCINQSWTRVIVTVDENCDRTKKVVNRAFWSSSARAKSAASGAKITACAANKGVIAAFGAAFAGRNFLRAD